MGSSGTETRIVGAAEAAYERHPAAGRLTETFIAEAVVAALANAGIDHREVDGFGVASFLLGPDHAVDLAWKLGFTVSWLMEDTNGGASGINLLQHAVRAIEAGDAETIVIAAGDRMESREFERMVSEYNQVTRDYLSPLPLTGPNALFAFITERYGSAHGLEREDFGCVPIAQRAWAAQNPGAVYRSPMTLAEYLEAPPVAPPLTRYDCVPIVSGGDALVLTSAERAERLGGPSVGVRAIRALWNHDQQDGDGIDTGFARFRDDLWTAAGVRPEDVGAAFVYDDYPVMVLAQLADLGLIGDGDLKRFLHTCLVEEHWPLNTSGGQLSAGQAGAAGGMHGLVEAVGQLRGEAGERQVEGLELALATGYGMVLYTHGASHNAAVLERHG
ncbi:MAG TPA: thiolase family protein [Solirubrobacterales bacterium]|nr:thiolase family protein [Solirubrobacterales bacterium]